MTKEAKPLAIVIHNATLDGTQDEWRVSKLVNGEYVPFGVYKSEETARNVCLGLTLRMARKASK